MSTVRLATPADANRLAEIAALSPEAGHWTAEDLRQNIAEMASRRCFLVDFDAQIAGFLLISAPVLDEAEVLTLAVDPAFRRKGLAEALLRHFLASKPAQIFLEVRQSNTAARALYERLGFRQTGLRHAYYSSPVEDGIVMQLTYFQSLQ